MRARPQPGVADSSQTPSIGFCGLILVLMLSVPMQPASGGDSSFAQTVLRAYGQQEADTLRTLLSKAQTRADSFLVRYRLYPLTEDASVIANLPSDLENGTAREYALLSGLWSYRAGEASMFSAIQYGRRATNLLDTAKDLAPDDPFVLLVQGQSRLFRPAIAGRDVQGAAECFAKLAQQARASDGISRVEALTWQWLALTEAGATKQAETLYQTLHSQTLPPLYQQFLDDPPDV